MYAELLPHGSGNRASSEGFTACSTGVIQTFDNGALIANYIQFLGLRPVTKRASLTLALK